MKWNASATILSLLLICSPAFAIEPEPVSLKAGEPAPWDAKCFTLKFAATMAYDATVGCDKRVEAECRLADELADVRINQMRLEHAADLEMWEAKIDLLTKRLERATAWWKSPLFVSSMAVVLTTTVILVARYLVIEAHPVTP